jgi:hypothetical protein
LVLTWKEGPMPRIEKDALGELTLPTKHITVCRRPGRLSTSRSAA